MTGWVKLHRKMLEWEWFKSVNTCHVFQYLLMTANREPSTYRGYAIPEGGRVHSVASIAANSGLSVMAVRGALRNLSSSNDVTIKTTTKFSIITITNWVEYQGEQQTKHQTKEQTEQQSKQQHLKKREERSKKEEDSESTVVDSIVASAPDEVREAYDFYCQSVEGYNESKAIDALPLPKPTKLTDKRRRELKRALKDLPTGRTFAEVVAKAGKCPQLMGENDRGWVINLDFLLRKGKFLEILEGRYPERPAAGAPGVRSGQRVSGSDLFTEN